MTNSNLAVRFTDEHYSSRPEVAKALGTNLIDSIWLQIVDYRRAFKKDISLINVYKIPYSICITKTLDSSIKSVEGKLDRVGVEYSALAKGSYERDTLRKDMLKNELRFLAKAKGIIVNDIALDNIISERNTDLLYEPLVRYYNVLKILEVNPDIQINEALIASHLEILNGGGELLSFYRTHDLVNPNQKVLINREYDGAPIHLIEQMMDSLLATANDENLSVITRLAAVYYGIQYIKPFEDHNDEMACLLMKYVLLSTYHDGSTVLLPLESILTENKTNVLNASYETQRNSDLTYFLIEMSKVADDACMCVLNRAIQVSRDVVEQSYLSEEEPTTNVVPEEKPVEVAHDVTPAVAPTPIRKPKPAPRPQVANNEPKVNVSVFQEMDEKALRRAAEDLLESDPTLRPGQAHFYVRHCTMGRYYTIQQYKKAEGCVYETARTSMDNLARAGYYRREQVKNKFVYTPISKE